MKSILDPTFRYTKSIDTDIRKTFARVRREQEKMKQLENQRRDNLALTVLPIKRVSA